MFIGTVHPEGNVVFFKTRDGEKLLLAWNGKIVEEGCLEYEYLFAISERIKEDVIFSGFKIGDVLNITKKHGRLFIVERIGQGVVNTRAVAKADKGTKVE